MICPRCKTECKKFGFFNNRCQRYRCNSCGKTFSDIPYRPLGRLKTPFRKATRIVNLLVEGMGVRAAARLTKTHPNTIQAILEVAGSKCAFFMDKIVREINFPFVQVDEMFCFVGCKEKNNVTGEPSRVKTIYKRQVIGLARLDKISTSCVDRTHLNLRLFNRRLARLTLGFSKKLEHLKHSVALSISHYNFCRVHHSLQGETPAMAARLTDHVWTIAELLTESGQIGSEKWVCPLDERTVSPPVKITRENNPAAHQCSNVRA